MSQSLLDDSANAGAQTNTPAQRMRTTMAALRLSFTWFGTRKTLSAAQKARAAASFGAEGEFLSAGKKLLNTRDPAFRACTSLRNRATAYVRSQSLPFPEPGLRLIRHDDVEVIDSQLAQYQEELVDAVTVLDERFSELKQSARQRLGDLYSEADYPDTLTGLFDLSWEFPSVEPPEYLRQLNPALYRQECQRVQARFDEAVRLAETAFMEELGRLVEHLHERLTGADDGRPKVFRDSAVTNLTEFFERFRSLSLHSHPELDALVERARSVLQGVAPQQLRDGDRLRQQLAGELARVQSSLDGLLVDRPRRNIQRSPH
ncbi:hypothetical protein [Maioricimonas sp. JC845]|uniref:hypothetical protein n=1 Tax=Maioricimonas sp. JC845 TaxID=3232138 RepID=UPI0034593037